MGGRGATGSARAAAEAFSGMRMGKKSAALGKAAVRGKFFELAIATSEEQRIDFC